MVDARGFATALLPILCFVLGTVLGLMVDGFIAQPGTVFEFLLRLQTLLGAAIVAGAVWIAAVVMRANLRRPPAVQAPTRGEDRQTAVQILAREEDRIEANFAGLEDAERLLLSLKTELPPSEHEMWGAIARDRLSREGLWADPDGMADLVLRKLPNTDLITRKRVEGILNYLVFWSSEAVDARTKAVQARHDVDLARQATDMKPEARAEYEKLYTSAAELVATAQAGYAQSLRSAGQLHEELSATILRWQRDRPVIRRILEAHIADSIRQAKAGAAN